jgi:hypothetical protein
MTVKLIENNRSNKEEISCIFLPLAGDLMNFYKN